MTENLPLLELRFVREIDMAEYLPSGASRESVTVPEHAASIARAVIGDDACNESFGVVYLDARNRPRGLNIMSTGGMSASVVKPREVLAGALLSGANGILLFHNHPSGNPVPSREDISITRRLTEAADLIGIKLIDHVIIGTGPDAIDTEHASLRERGLL